VSAGIRLFYLPHAGGGARAFPGWPAALPRSVLVEPVHLPGREDRATEPPEFDVAEVADLIAARIDGAYAVFGHGMGARLHTLRGGHFFVTTALRTVAATIAADLLADPSRPAAAPTSIRLPEPDEVHLFVDDPDGTDPADDGALRRVLVRYGAAPGGTRATVHLELPGATCTPALPVPGARLRYETAGPAPR
jgi:hypothetical protein